MQKGHNCCPETSTAAYQSKMLKIQ